MREFEFELRLCARLAADGALLARQLGTGVHRPGTRVADVLRVDPGPGFEARRAITSATIPDLAIEADVGPGRARPVSRVVAGLDAHPERARAAIERAVEVGFLERERRDGRDCVRQVARYPTDWVDRIVAVENKPDLDRPGDLSRQLRTDVALGLVDAVVLATASHVTGAHRNRLPDEVGLWRFRDGDLDVLREPTPLSPGEPGIELVEEHPGRTDVRTVAPAEKRRRRRVVAERAYGKGWRPDALPGCGHARAERVDGVRGLPGCGYHGRLVNPGAECGPSCPGFEPAEPPAVDLEAERDRTSPWVAEPPGLTRRQSGLDRFG